MKPVLFLDSGGVINDNEARAPQWRPLVAAFFAPRLGGSHARWEEANRITIERLFDPVSVDERFRRATGFAAFDREYNRDWLYMMCEIVGVKPPDEEEAVALAVQASREIVKQVHAPMPGASAAVLALHRAGFELHTASGEHSEDLGAILANLGIRHCFACLYGPDLIDTLKVGPEFYRTIFSHAGVSAHTALVVDDSVAALGWAAEAGAQTILVKKEPPPGWAAAHIRSIAELPQYLAGLD